MIDEEALGKLLRAGEIAEAILDEAGKLLVPGASARKICERLESRIVELGGRPAFPCNFSVNEVAAHYTPGIEDDIILEGDEVVKVDVGVHVDGYIADTARTFDLSGKHEKLLEAARDALQAVISAMRPGISLYEIGRRIEQAIRRKGFKPIRNLSGHTISRWIIHAGISIPNYGDRRAAAIRLRPGTIAAIEPFATNGRGMVKDGSIVNIYAYTGKTPRIPLSEEEAKILHYIIEEYKTLPFTPRWLTSRFPPEIVRETVKSLTAKGVLYDYPILVEAGKGLVSQFEHTFVILNDRVIVTTCKACGQSP